MFDFGKLALNPVITLLKFAMLPSVAFPVFEGGAEAYFYPIPDTRVPFLFPVN
ncbi:hypothetical protein [Mucilaginibacter agri]|uniref:Uncharacterized protein n=1 Tax=Mucilaginibacter agri TaxID=2695265 RepID=A0A965ZIR5_9SPHI|nr:hypothetical protein [Mucilaginibacter agri]NCD71835.1 hypothetical protein [Mucilaginibacter agri]